MYSYKGMDARGKNVGGSREADTPKGLRQLLKREGVVVTTMEVTKASGQGKGKGLNREVEVSFIGGVNAADVAGFTRQLATLLKAGLPLAEALSILAEQIDKPKFKAAVSDVRTKVNEGASFADALAKHNKIFDDLFVSMVRSGESAGNMDDVLLRLAEFQEASGELKSKVITAMIYPALMAVVGVGVVIFMFVFVVPQLTKIFESQDRTLPVPTRVVIVISKIFANYWWLLLAMLVGGILFLRSWARTPVGKLKWHGLLLKTPIFGKLLRQVAVARFARTLGTMLTAGVPMLKALDAGKQVLRNAVLGEAIEKAKSGVTEGEQLATLLKKSGHFPSTVTHMIAVGERSGQLEQMLVRVAEAQERDVSVRLGRMTALLEPIMLIVMGLVVMFIVVATLLPLMDMARAK